jgi:hypothetical protein
VTRDGIGHGADSVLAILAAGHTFERYHLLLAHSALACRMLLIAPEVYTDHQLAEFVTNAARGVELLRGEDSKEAQAASRLQAAVGRLAAEAVVWRIPLGARSC